MAAVPIDTSMPTDRNLNVFPRLSLHLGCDGRADETSALAAKGARKGTSLSDDVCVSLKPFRHKKLPMVAEPPQATLREMRRPLRGGCGVGGSRAELEVGSSVDELRSGTAAGRERRRQYPTGVFWNGCGPRASEAVPDGIVVAFSVEPEGESRDRPTGWSREWPRSKRH